jgi:hypothetical protein
MNIVTASEIERNRTGSLIVKVTETGKNCGVPFTKINYVVRTPSRLVMLPVRGEKGRFTKEKLAAFVPWNAETATGTMFGARYDTLAEARLSLGINTSPKRASVIARLNLLAA